MYWKIKRRAAASAMVVAAVLAGCGDGPAEAPKAAKALAAPVTVKHQLGTTTVANVPRKVAVLDMNEADFLDQLGV
ncbi:MAG: ferric anguibactin-binding protein, partial [Achromobacter sp.]|nr:ferric anguibactin-binding protein [Achromobacter sp.]